MDPALTKNNRVNKLLEDQLVRLGKINQVSKLNLLKEETPESRSRMCDLFRVTFEMNTEDMVERQRLDNPEAFDQLDSSVISTLKKRIEMAEDFDVVIDARGNTKYTPLGKAGAYCLNERIYSEHFLSDENKIENGSLLLSGNAEILSVWLEKTKSWLSVDPKNVIHLVLPKGETVQSVSNQNPIAKEVLEHNQRDMEEEAKLVEQKLKEWNEMEDYVRVKYPRPQARPPKIQVYENVGIVSIDRLDDHQDYFVSLEVYENFKTPASSEIKTLGAHQIINAYDKKFDSSVYEYLNTDEDGLYIVNTNETSKKIFDEVFNDIKKYFSPN